MVSCIGEAREDQAIPSCCDGLVRVTASNERVSGSEPIRWTWSDGRIRCPESNEEIFRGQPGGADENPCAGTPMCGRGRGNESAENSADAASLGVTARSWRRLRTLCPAG